MENWKEIEGTNGIYYVSDLGNVKKLVESNLNIMELI